MKRLRPLAILCVLIILCSSQRSIAAEDAAAIKLPPPQMNGGKPLMQAIKERKTTREFSPDGLALQTLGNLLWAAYGINRPETAHRTVPSAMNSQELDIYVALPDGLFIYEAQPHHLKPVLKQDLRRKTNGSPWMTNVPVVLIFVADLPRLTKAKPETRPFYAGIDTGYVSQNVYLFCASEGLATVVYDLDRPPLAKAMNLKPEQQIILSQAVGYPKTAGEKEKQGQ